MLHNTAEILRLPSPVQQISLPCTTEKQITLLVKRDDLIHGWISGNKYRKLKYNLDFARKTDKKTIVTFGGAFSNHLHATAGACALFGFKSIGIVRGELDMSNPTLKFCHDRGMLLTGVSRTSYKQKENAPELPEILRDLPELYLIPEGGTNPLALQGAAEIVDELQLQGNKTPDYIILAAGTGGTAAGILTSENLDTRVIAFSALKSDHLHQEIIQLAGYKNADKLTVNTDYHFGGYAKWNPVLLEFIDTFEKNTGIPLDHVYNGKAMYGLIQMITNDYFTPGTTICYIHTGGLQGKLGLEYRMRK